MHWHAQEAVFRRYNRPMPPVQRDQSKTIDDHDQWSGRQGSFNAAYTSDPRANALKPSLLIFKNSASGAYESIPGQRVIEPNVVNGHLGLSPVIEVFFGIQNLPRIISDQPSWIYLRRGGEIFR